MVTVAGALSESPATEQEGSRRSPPPLFFVGAIEESAASRPVVLLNGGLLLDSGEVDRTFVYRGQDRYLGLATVLGWRPLFFVAGDDHVALYRRAIDRWRAKYQIVRAATGVLPNDDARDPVFVGCDLRDMRLYPCAALVEALRDEELRAALRRGIHLNQLSPTYADLLGQLGDVLAANGVPVAWDVEAAREVGALALRLHDKRRYVELVESAPPVGLPEHVPTVTASPAACLAHRDWVSLRRWYESSTGESGVDALFMKSSRDSGGNVAVRLTAETFASAMARFRRDVALFVEHDDSGAGARVAEARADVARSPVLSALGVADDDLARFTALRAPRRSGIHILVQREVRPPRDHDRGFAGIGLSYVVHDDGAIDLVAVGGQTYRDADRRLFAGSYVGDDVASDARVAECAAATRGLIARFSAMGYRGPINVDARLGARDGYELIYDCNPRLTAIFPALAVRAMLRRAGLPARSVLSLGYRGDFDGRGLDAVVRELDREGVLYTTRRHAGAVLVPNLSRDDGVDVALVNVPVDEAAAVLGSMTRGSRLCRDGDPVTELYW